MAVRTAEATALDSTVEDLKAQIHDYLEAQQPGEKSQATVFWQWLVAQLRASHPRMAQAIVAGQLIVPSAGRKTLVELDPYA